MKTVIDGTAAIPEKKAFVIKVNGGAQGRVHANVDCIPTDRQAPYPLTAKNTVEFA
jgi:hypothetical protein